MESNGIKLSAKLLEIAKQQINENPERTEEDLKIIKEWLHKQVYINARTDDQWLLMFLRCCKFSIERTKEKLDKFYTMKTLVPEIFKNRNPFDSKMQDILRKGVNLPLNNPINEEDIPILIMKQASFDINKYNLYDLIKAHIMVADITTYRNNQCMVNGVITLIDLEGINIEYLAVPLTTYKKINYILSDSYPIRIKEVRFINVPTIIEKLVNTVISFMSEKMRKRVAIYSKENIDKAFQGLPKNIIPVEYGGNGESIQIIAERMKKIVEEHIEWFKEDENYCTNENLRLGKPLTINELFGIDGTFRKLAVD